MLKLENDKQQDSEKWQFPNVKSEFSANDYQMKFHRSKQQNMKVLDQQQRIRQNWPRSTTPSLPGNAESPACETVSPEYMHKWEQKIFALNKILSRTTELS